MKIKAVESLLKQTKFITLYDDYRCQWEKDKQEKETGTWSEEEQTQLSLYGESEVDGQ